jgi:hypothetical protein
MKRVLLISLLITSTAFAQEWRNPEAKFNTSKNRVNNTTVSWKVVDNVQQTCDAEGKRRGHGAFKFAVTACSFWENSLTGNSCIIITGPTTTMHELGHETRHCFQGSFH